MGSSSTWRRCRTRRKRGRGGGFLIRPSDYTFVEEEATRLKRELLGFYHSHPDHPARPSQYDLDHAFPFFWYVIVSIQQAQPENMTVWRLADDRSQFREAPLHE